jgi:hypothetical protein
MKKHIKKFYTFINENISNLILYHGGPFKFDTFSIEHIGNGEGFHQFGWGIYFSDDIKLAKNYRNKAYNKYELYSINKKLSDLVEEMDKYRTGVYGKFTDQKGYELKKEYDDLIIKRSNEIRKNNSLYEVIITKTNPEWLYWNKNLTEKQILMIMNQSKKENINIEINKYNYIMYFYENLYNKDSKTGFKTNKEASLFLNRAGFDGIKFIREQDKELNPIGFNYVIFNDKIIKIIKIHE